MIKIAKIVKDAELTEALNKDEPTVVYYCASWCGPCKMMSPVMDEIASEYGGKVNILKAKVEDCPNNVSEFSIGAVPTILFLKNGEVVSKTTGLIQKDAVIENIEKIVN